MQRTLDANGVLREIDNRKSFRSGQTSPGCEGLQIYTDCIRNSSTLRIQRNLTKEALAAELGISESTIKKYENGERALSITNLFKIIDYFKVDANTILNVAESKKETSIDSRLELMDCSKRAYFQKIFNEMLDSAEMLVS